MQPRRIDNNRHGRDLAAGGHQLCLVAGIQPVALTDDILISLDLLGLPRKGFNLIFLHQGTGDGVLPVQADADAFTVLLHLQRQSQGS